MLRLNAAVIAIKIQKYLAASIAAYISSFINYRFPLTQSLALKFKKYLSISYLYLKIYIRGIIVYSLTLFLRIYLNISRII